MEKHLENPPLVEVLLELRWKLRQPEGAGFPVDPAYPIVVGLLYEQVKADFPFVEDLAQSRLSPEMLQYSIAHRFRAGPDCWPLVQIGPGIASLNFTTSYSWPDFESSAKQFIERLTRAYEVAADTPPLFEQVMLRYINAVDLGSMQVDLQSFLREQLHIALALPTPGAVRSEATAPSDLRLQVVYPAEPLSGLAILNLGTGRRQGQLALLWDLSVVWTEAEGLDLARFVEWVADAHQLIENWFFTLIAGPLYDRFRGGA